MRIREFFERLPALFEAWGTAAMAPHDASWAEVADGIEQGNTVNFYQVVSAACGYLERGEIFCEIGCLAGGNLVAALRENPEVLGYGIDFYSPDEEETDRRIGLLQDNLERFGVLERVCFSHTSVEDFFAELGEYGLEERFGVYVYNFVPDYRQVLMSLLWSRPHLADQGLLIINNSQVPSVQQAINDFLGMEPSARVLLDWQLADRQMFGGQGLAMLAWDVDRELTEVEPLVVEGMAEDESVNAVAALWSESTRKKVLHVGCGPYNPNALPEELQTEEWQEIRLDINPVVKPDVLGTITDLSAIPDNSVDAVYSSHNIEHIYTYEVPLALQEFKRVLKPGGKAVITCPDIQAVATEVAKGNLEDTLYISPAGPIAAIDILYGLGTDLARGNFYMAHKTAFTIETLRQKLLMTGFNSVEMTRNNLNLWAIAYC
jgi:hypothetical protein